MKTLGPFAILRVPWHGSTLVGFVAWLACAILPTIPADAASRRSEQAMRNVDQLSLEVSFDRPAYRPDETIRLILRYTNRGTRELPILVAYRTPSGNHYDQLHITIRDMASAKHWTVFLVGVRKAVEPFGCVLGPGATLTQPLDLTSWLDRMGIRLTTGEYTVVATYQVEVSTTAVHHPSLCGPLLDGVPQSTAKEGEMLECATGPFRSSPVILRFVTP